MTCLEIISHWQLINCHVPACWRAEPSEFSGNPRSGSSTETNSRDTVVFLGEQITSSRVALGVLCLEPQKRRKQLKGSREPWERMILTTTSWNFPKSLGEAL